MHVYLYTYDMCVQRAMYVHTITILLYGIKDTVPLHLHGPENFSFVKILNSSDFPTYLSPTIIILIFSALPKILKLFWGETDVCCLVLSV